MRTAIKQDLNRDLNHFDWAIWVVFENKTNATSHQNIGSLKIAVEEEWNKMSEEFVLKTCKPFRRHVDTITEKMAAVLGKFSILELFSCFFFFYI